MPKGVYIRTDKNLEKLRALHSTQEYKDERCRVSKERGCGLHMRGKIPPFVLQGKHYHPAGEEHYNWKGGISAFRTGRNSVEWKEWRERVFERDEYTCQGCEEVGCYLEPHHLYSYSEYPQYRFEDWNGQTLCRDCHIVFNGRKVG